MTSIRDLPHVVAAYVDAILDSATICTPTDTVVTAGEPAHPTTDCTDPAVWVWLDQIYASDQPNTQRGDDAGCVIRTVATIQVRVDVCYQETDDAAGPTPAMHLAAADCLHHVMGVLWCGIADEITGGKPFGLGSCRAVTVGAFEVGVRQGMIVSATLPLRVEVDCAIGS